MKPTFVAFFLAALFLVPAPAAAQAVRVVGRTDEGVDRPGPIHARVGERITLSVQQRRRGRWRSLPDGAQIRWLRVAPNMQHVDTEPPNEGIQQYSNSVLFGPEHGRWLGYDTIEYLETPIETAGEALVFDRASFDGERVRFEGAGSLWLAAEVTLPDGTTVRTAGADAVDRLGLRPEVFRVSFRTGDDFLGWLSTYFHVPNVFGSTGAQSDRYVGADCADVLVGALRSSGRRSLRYTSVGGITSVAQPVSDPLRLEDGVVRDEEGNEVSLRWNDDVRPGDFLAIDYIRAGARMPRSWDHIGAVVGDGDGDGTLSGGDLLRHMTPRGLLDRPLGDEGTIRIRLFRPRNASSTNRIAHEPHPSRARTPSPTR